MKLKNLKIGDRVKYKFPNYDKSKMTPYLIHEGVIAAIDVDSFIIETSEMIWPRILKKDIVSKLEPIPPQYKEIPIEKESGPKSYKFLFTVTSYETNNYGWNRWSTKMIGNVTLENGDHETDVALPFILDNPELGKVYSCEIKIN